MLGFWKPNTAEIEDKIGQFFLKSIKRIVFLQFVGFTPVWYLLSCNLGYLKSFKIKTM